MVYPLDPTTVRSFLDLPTTQPDEEICSLISDTIGLLIDAFVWHQPEASQLLDQRLGNSNPLVAHWQKK